MIFEIVEMWAYSEGASHWEVSIDIQSLANFVEGGLRDFDGLAGTVVSSEDVAQLIALLTHDLAGGETLFVFMRPISSFSISTMIG